MNSKGAWRKRFWCVIFVSCFLVTVGLAQVLPPGIPRAETLIVDSIHGRLVDPTQANMWVPGTQIGSGLNNLVMDNLWYVDHGTGEFINALAADTPKYSDDFDALTIPLREGIYWSDGVEFTADDVAFTINYLKKHAGLMWSSDFRTWVESAEAVDRYTVHIKLTRPNPRFHFILTCDIWSGCTIMPKHIFEDVDDPMTFKFWPPVALGAYVHHSHDPRGDWILFERRDDWERTSLGMVKGKPAPRYVMFDAPGPEERKIIAQTRHEMDWIFDVTAEGWYLLMDMNPYTGSWFEDFPWAYFHDPTARGLWYNVTREPYDNKWVRWALTLSVDMYDVMLTAYDGIQILVPTAAGMGMAHFELYHKGMLDWLKDFELLPGYKPFDAELPYRLADYAVEQGYTVDLDPVDVWGPGWWRYDPAKAEELLKNEGFTRRNGNWYLPDGSRWSITLTTPDYEVDATRLGFAAADQWRKFGIEVRVNVLASAPFSDSLAYGNFDVGTFWSSDAQGGIIPDTWFTHRYWHKDNIVPVGEYGVLNAVRWENELVSNLLDKMAAMSPDDPELIELGKEMFKEIVREMPIAPTVDCKKFSPYDTYYWEGFPNALDPYWSPLFWCGGFNWILPHLTPTGR